MAATLEQTGQLERRLDISLAPAEIDGEVETRLKQLARNVKMHGFRPGKVPLKVVAQQYGEQVRREVLGDVLQKNFGEAVRAQNLKIAGYPRFEPKGVAEGAMPVEFSATFEIYPEIAVGDVAKATIERPQVETSEAEVDKTIDIMRKQRASYCDVSRAAADGDRVTIDFAGTIGGTPFEGGTGSDVAIILGEGRLLKDFETQVVGMVSGASKTFDLRFPDDYHGKEVAGKSATFEVKLKAVAEPKLPAVDADFAKALGVADGSVETMRKEVRENLEREVKRRINGKVKDQIMQALIDSTEVVVPKSLVEMEIERMSASMKQELEARGVKGIGDGNLPIDGAMFEPAAQRRVKLGLILAEVVKAHGLQAKPEQVRAMVDEQAQTYEAPEQVVKWYYQSPDRLREIESMAVEENVVAWALATAKVSDKKTDFDELMGSGK
jgi:trigger factor